VAGICNALQVQLGVAPGKAVPAEAAHLGACAILIDEHATVLVRAYSYVVMIGDGKAVDRPDPIDEFLDSNSLTLLLDLLVDLLPNEIQQGGPRGISLSLANLVQVYGGNQTLATVPFSVDRVGGEVLDTQPQEIFGKKGSLEKGLGTSSCKHVGFEQPRVASFLVGIVHSLTGFLGFGCIYLDFMLYM